MSNNERFKLELVVDDSKIKKLLQDFENVGLGSKASAGGKSGGGLLGGLGGFKNLGKLAGMAIGITAIVGLMKKITSLVLESSPILKGMLKLFNTSLMIIFRPIGDFIGFFLRPIIIFFLRNVALPFYKIAAPIMRQWGTTLGNALVGFLQDPFGSVIGFFKGLNWETLLGLTPIGIALKGILSAADLFNIDLGQITAGIGTKFTGLMNSVSETLSPIFGGFIQGMRENFSRITNIFGGIWNSAQGGLLLAWNGITKFFTDGWNFISGTLQPVWDGIMGFVQGIVDVFKSIFEFLKNIPIIGGLFGGEQTTITGNPITGGGRQPGSQMATGGDTINITIEGIHVGSDTSAVGDAINEALSSSKRSTRYS